MLAAKILFVSSFLVASSQKIQVSIGNYQPKTKWKIVEIYKFQQQFQNL